MVHTIKQIYSPLYCHHAFSNISSGYRTYTHTHNWLMRLKTCLFLLISLAITKSKMQTNVMEGKKLAHTRRSQSNHWTASNIEQTEEKREQNGNTRTRTITNFVIRTAATAKNPNFNLDNILVSSYATDFYSPAFSHMVCLLIHIS